MSNVSSNNNNNNNNSSNNISINTNSAGVNANHLASSFQPYSFSNNRLKYCCDIDKDVLSSNFEKRGWTNVNNDEDWNFYWYSFKACNYLSDIKFLL